MRGGDWLVGSPPPGARLCVEVISTVAAEAATVADLAALVAVAADTVEASVAAEESLPTPDLD